MIHDPLTPAALLLASIALIAALIALFRPPQRTLNYFTRIDQAAPPPAEEIANTQPVDPPEGDGTDGRWRESLREDDERDAQP